MAQSVPGNFGVQTRTFLLVPVRVFLGVVLFLQMYSQWDSNWVRGNGLRDAWEPSARLVFFAPLWNFLVTYVFRNSELAGFVILALELLVGVLLIIGLYVRLASLLGMALSGLQLLVFGVGYRTLAQVEGAATLVGQGFRIHMPDFALYGLMFLVFLVLMLTGAGRSFGLDGMVWRRRAGRLPRAEEENAEARPQIF